MTSADTAFNRLLEKNALGIPVANPDPDAAAPVLSAAVPGAVVHDGVHDGALDGAHAAAHVNGSASGDMSEAMRVLDLLDDRFIYGDSGDYSPPRYPADESERAFTTPTETELDPVDAPVGILDAVADARSAETVRSASMQDVPDADDLREASAAVVDEEHDAGIGGTGGGAGNAGADTQIDIGGDTEIRKARRFRRFAYLPLGGMEYFENRARDVMASLASQEPDRPSLAITSPSRGDGRTELAIRLALAMAKRVDYRVLLADFDVRKPRIAARLGLSSKYFTVADVLRGSCPLGEALAASEEDNLYVLPARATDREGDEVLNDKQVQALMAKIHASFDFAVINCGAADHADAAIVCRHAGATALAGFCRRTPARALRDAADRLGEAGANIAGMLLTGV